jgi:hypothetical protein
MPNQSWVTDGVLTGIVTLATAGGLAIARPAEALIAAGGGTTVAFGTTAVLSRRRAQAHQRELLQVQQQTQQRSLPTHRLPVRDQPGPEEAPSAAQVATTKPAPIKPSPNKLSKPEPAKAPPIKAGSAAAPVKSSPAKPSPAKPSSAQPSPAPAGISIATLPIPAPAEATAPHPLPSQPALAHLVAQGIEIDPPYESPETSDPLNAVFNTLAGYLGKNYDRLGLFHRRLKANLPTAQRFGLSLQGRSQEEIQCLKSFGNQLKQNGFVARFGINREKQSLYVAPQPNEALRHFLEGGWFERFVADSVVQILKAKGIPYDAVFNCSVKFPSGKKTELDLLFWVGGHPLWIECKAGQGYDEYLRQYSDQRKWLKVPKAQAFLVVLDLDEDLADIRTRTWDITVTDQNSLGSFIEDWVDELLATAPTLAPVQVAQSPPSLAGESPAVVATAAIASPTLVATTSVTEEPTADPLKATKTKPYPDIRQPVIRELVAVFAERDQRAATEALSGTAPNGLRQREDENDETGDEDELNDSELVLDEVFDAEPDGGEPTDAELENRDREGDWSLNDVKRRVADRLGLGKNRVNRVLLGLKSARLLLDQKGQNIYTTNQPIHRLQSTDPQVLDQHYMDRHDSEILQIDPTFFDDPHNCDRYQQVTQRSAPDAATIQRLRRQIGRL